MNPLKSYGIGERLLEDLVRLSINNPDQHNRYIGNALVSPYLLTESKFAKKLYESFLLLGIYNIIYVLIKPGVHTFIGRSGKVKELELRFEVSKKEIKSVKDAYVKALLDFINQIKNN